MANSWAAVKDTALRRGFGIVQRALRRANFDLRWVPLPEEPIPDREYYRPQFSPWLQPEWQRELRAGDLHSLVTLDRKYVLYSTLKQALLNVAGDVAECGVYKGGTAYIMAELINTLAPDRRLFLFDTFDGMPETDRAHDRHVAGQFNLTSLDAVRRYLGAFDNVQFAPGFIPDTLAAFEDRHFSFVHIDLDIYQAILAASQFFFDRVAPGGFIVYDDYGFASCPGARRAVDEFYAEKRLSPLVLSTGQCVVFKGHDDGQRRASA